MHGAIAHHATTHFADRKVPSTRGRDQDGGRQGGWEGNEVE